MLEIRNPGGMNGKVSYSYVTDCPIIPGDPATVYRFMNELTITIDQVLQAAQKEITRMDEGRAWDMLYECVKMIRGPITTGEQKKREYDASLREMSFNYFTQYADYLIPDIINEIYKKYGKEYLASCLTPGDMMSSAKEQVISSAWLYISARKDADEERMFACAKQLIAASNNQKLVGEIMNEIT